MNLHKNIYLWYVNTFLAFTAFTLPIWVIFNTEVLGLSNTQAFILGILSYGTSAFFEIPTGSWSDKYGRVKIYRLGTILYILSVSSYVIFSNFYILAIFQVIGGLGLAMQSGCLEALIHDTLKKTNKEHLYVQIHGRKMAILFISRVVTVITSGVMFAVNPRLPYLISVIVYLFGFVNSLFFEEIRIEKLEKKASNIGHIKETLRLILNKQTLAIFFVLTGIYTFFSEFMFSLYQPYFKSLGIHIGEFGIFYAIISVFSAIGALLVSRFVKKFNPFAILFFMMVAVLFTLSMMLFRIPDLTYLAIIPSSVAFGFIVTLHNTITQRLVSSKNQATAVSIASFVRTFSFMLSVVLVGLSLDLFNITDVNLTMVILTACMTVPFFIYFRKKIKL